MLRSLCAFKLKTLIYINLQKNVDVCFSECLVLCHSAVFLTTDQKYSMFYLSKGTKNKQNMNELHDFFNRQFVWFSLSEFWQKTAANTHKLIIADLLCRLTLKLRNFLESFWFSWKVKSVTVAWWGHPNISADYTHRPQTSRPDQTNTIPALWLGDHLWWLSWCFFDASINGSIDRNSWHTSNISNISNKSSPWSEIKKISIWGFLFTSVLN